MATAQYQVVYGDGRIRRKQLSREDAELIAKGEAVVSVARLDATAPETPPPPSLVTPPDPTDGESSDDAGEPGEDADDHPDEGDEDPGEDSGAKRRDPQRDKRREGAANK